MLCVSLEKSRCGCHLPVVGWDGMGLSRGSGSWLRISCRRLNSLFTRVQVLHKRKKACRPQRPRVPVAPLRRVDLDFSFLLSPNPVLRLSSWAAPAERVPPRAAAGRAGQLQPRTAGSRSEAINKQLRSAG